MIETEELVWGKFPQVFSEGWCEKCRKYVRMTNLINAARVVGLDEKTLDFCTSSGKVHTAFTGGEEPLLCLESLLFN